MPRAIHTKITRTCERAHITLSAIRRERTTPPELGWLRESESASDHHHAPHEGGRHLPTRAADGLGLHCVQPCDVVVAFAGQSVARGLRCIAARSGVGKSADGSVGQTWYLFVPAHQPRTIEATCCPHPPHTRMRGAAHITSACAPTQQLRRRDRRKARESSRRDMLDADARQCVRVPPIG